ncbi:MAG: hypothetical protein ACE5K3_10400 [bacterium]
MRKKVKIVGAIAGLGIVLMATLTFAQQPSPQFPQVPLQRFQPPITGGEQLVDPISYPADWNVEEQQCGVAFTCQERAELDLLLVEDQQLLSQGPLAIVYTLEQQISSQASDYQRVSAVSTQISQYPGARLTYTSTSPGGYPEKGMLVGVVTTPHRGFLIICTAPADIFGQVEATFNQMLSSFRESGEMRRTPEEPPVLAKERATVTRFKTFKYIDKQEGMGIEAFRMLIPSDWQFEGGIRWILDNPRLPAVAGFRVGNPEGEEQFEVFPTQAFFWTDNETVLSMFPIGSRYFGHEVHPLVKPVEALKQIVVPRFRGNVSNLRIVNEKLLPELAEAVGAGTEAQPGVFSSAEAAKIQIEYDLNGIGMEEEIYTVIQSHSFPIQVWGQMRTHTLWYVDYIFSFKTEKGELDANSKTFQTIAYSFQLNPLWFSKFIQVVEYLIKNEIHIIKSWGELGRIISQIGSEIRDEDMDRWNQRQAAKDKMVDNFCQYIRGVEKYYNPIEGKPVELPSGYQKAWTNSLGEYILSENPNFNPNIGSPINWQPIKKTQ